MRRALAIIIVAAVALAAVVVLAIVVVLPRLDWSAAAEPGEIETKLAGTVISGWVRRNASGQPNPFTETAQNLKVGQSGYDAHCASCHGHDGSGQNRFEADFYPPVPKLTGDLQQLSDGELYFIIANGIRYSGMPAFKADHSADDIWRTVLWVRHLARLTPREKAALEARQKQATEEHEATMEGKPHEAPSTPLQHGEESH